MMPANFNLYLSDLKTKAACERYFEKIVESLIDLAYLIIKEKSLKAPEGDKETFDSLANAQIIPESLAIKLKPQIFHWSIDQWNSGVLKNH